MSSLTRKVYHGKRSSIQVDRFACPTKKTWFSWRRVETAAGSVYYYFKLKQAAAAASQSLLLFDANEAILLGCVRFYRESPVAIDRSIDHIWNLLCFISVVE
jgi:hypothetical protein